MTRYPLTRIAPALLAAALLVSCGDDGGDTAANDTTTAGESSTTAAEGSETSAADGASTEPAGGEGDEATGAASHGWSYDPDAPNGPDGWGGVCESGDRQSPIDIVDAEEAPDEDLPDIGFSYAPDQEATVGDSGHAIQVDHAPGSTITVRDLETGDDVAYELKQFHFHAHSEHEIAGEQQPVEVHFVHVATDGSGRRAVIGVLVAEGEESSAYAAVVDAAAALPPHASHEPEGSEEADAAGGEAETTTTVAAEAPQESVAVDVSTLLPEDLTYFRYAGSLTTPTPTCEENVTWHVMTEPIEMSAEQIAVFADRYEDGNARPVTREGAEDLQDSRG